MPFVCLTVCIIHQTRLELGSPKLTVNWHPYILARVWFWGERSHMKNHKVHICKIFYQFTRCGSAPCLSAIQLRKLRVLIQWTDAILLVHHWNKLCSELYWGFYRHGLSNQTTLCTTPHRFTTVKYHYTYKNFYLPSTTGGIYFFSLTDEWEGAAKSNQNSQKWNNFLPIPVDQLIVDAVIKHTTYRNSAQREAPPSRISLHTALSKWSLKAMILPGSSHATVNRYQFPFPYCFQIRNFCMVLRASCLSFS